MTCRCRAKCATDAFTLQAPEMILPESRLTTLRFARTYFARAPAARTSVHVKSATPMHRGCITDLLCKSVTFTKTRGGLSARQMSGKSQSSALSIPSISFPVLLYVYHLTISR